MMKSYKNIFDFKSKRVVVTGGAGLIGSAVVRCFVEFGANVIIADINKKNADDLIETLEGLEGSAVFYFFDQGKLESLARQIDSLEKQCGEIDVWINNAYPRTNDWGKKLEEVELESWRKNVDMQLNGYCIASNEVAKRMASRSGGCIVTVGSIQSFVAPDFRIYKNTQMTSPAAYTAIKGGVLMYSKYLASYYGKKKVRVNVVCPGGVFNNQPDEFITRYNKKTLLGRLADATEVAPAVLFLASEGASYITGTWIVVDGGLTAI